MKKFASVLLALLLFTVFPLVAFAEEVDYSTIESVLTRLWRRCFGASTSHQLSNRRYRIAGCNWALPFRYY